MTPKRRQQRGKYGQTAPERRGRLVAGRGSALDRRMNDQPDWRRSAATPRASQTVTASALVRQFGTWQERAAKAPVYILHRGRPRLVLTSIDVMEALCAPHADPAAGATLAESLLDSIRELVVILDLDMKIVTVSRAARGYFGVAAPEGMTLDRLAPGATVDFLIAAASRVLESGLAETIEVAAARYARRRLSIAIVPCPTGVGLYAQDITVADDLKEARERLDALDQALAIVEDVAAARINLRGYLCDVSPSLAALTAIPAETLASVRFVTLFDVASRVAVGDAIEAVIADGVPRAARGLLLVNRAAPRPVRIGLSRARRNLAPDGVAAILIADAHPTGG